MLQFRVGDRPCFKLVARDLTRAVINLTGASVKFRYKIGSAAAVEQTATITDALLGLAEYWIQAAEWTVAGSLYWEWEITDSGGRIATGPMIPRHGTLIAKLT